jgi:hypothetical protein
MNKRITAEPGSITPTELALLTRREREVLAGQMEGLTFEAIAERLGLKDGTTVSNYAAQARVHLRKIRAVAPPPDEWPAAPASSETLETARERQTNSRSVTLGGRYMGREERKHLAIYPDDIERPRTRADCENQPRPCPWVSCSHHLYLDVTAAGSLKLNHPHLEVWEMRESCLLDVADRGGVTLEQVGEIMNLTRERVRQLEVMGLLRAREGGEP